MTLTADPSALNGDLKRQASALFRTKRTWSFAWPLAVLAYLTDTIAESDKVDAVRISSKAAKAIQPFSIARSSRQKHLARRLKQHIVRSREDFEAAGFHWRLDTDKSNP